MNDISVKDFFEKHNACESGVAWAKRNVKSGMMSEAYDKLLAKAKIVKGQENAAYDYLWWVMSNAWDDKTLRLISVRMVRETPLPDGRKVVDLLTDQRSLNALDVAERFANGNATLEELAAARAASWDASWDAARAASWDAAWAEQVKIIAYFGNPFKGES